MKRILFWKPCSFPKLGTTASCQPPNYHSTASLSLTRDLLHKDQSQRLELKERPDTGTYVKDLSSFVCKSVTEIEHVMSVGNGNRSVG